MTSPRYGSLSARTECNHCGAPLPLDAPALEVSCAQCSGQVSVPAETWESMLTDLDEQIDKLAEGQGRTTNKVVGGQKLVYEIKREMPHCEKCGTPLEIADLPVGTSRNLACAQCGDPASTEPAPPWLGQMVPNARQLYRADPDPGLEASNRVELSPPPAPRPVALTCPSCGAGLHITVENPRLTSCEFCNADVYLPDAVWRKLHPVKVVTPFYVRFEGQTRAKIEELLLFMKRHDAANRSHVAPAAPAAPTPPDAKIALLFAFASPFGGYFLGSTYNWPWVTAIGLFLLSVTWFVTSIRRGNRASPAGDARASRPDYAREMFLPALRELMAREGYPVELVKKAARAEMDATSAAELLKVVDELA